MDASAHFYVNSTFNPLTIQSIIVTQTQKKSISMTNNQIELAKKLQILQNENRILQQSRDSIQNNIRRLVDDINTRDQLLQQKTSDKQNLSRKNKELSTTCRKLELQNQRLNQQYSSLYNYACQQRKRGSRQLVIKEMELSNRLNEIQFQGYAKVIEQLRQTLSAKNIEVSQLISQNGKLKKDLLNTTYQFHEQIYTLKEQIAALKVEATAVLFNQSQKRLSEENSQSLVTQKIQNMKKEIKLYEKQYASISKQLLQCKNQINRYKREAQWLQSKLQKKDPTNRAQYDYQKAKELMDQNDALKNEIEHQKLKIIRILQENPQLMQYINDFDMSNPLEDLRNKIKEHKLQLQIKEKENKKLNDDLKKITDQKNNADQEFLKTRAEATKVVAHLKGIINKYLPFINFYGFGEFGLNEQECKYLEQDNIGMAKEFDRMCLELSNNKIQLRQLQGKLKEVEENLKIKNQKIEIQSKKIQELSSENEKMFAGLETLKKKTGVTPTQKQPIQQQDLESQELPDIISSDSEEASENQNNFYKEQHNSKVQNLKELVSEMQQQRQKCLQIIRSKDMMLAGANAEIAMLKQQSTAKVYTFSTLTQLSSVKVQHSRRDRQSVNYTQFLEANSSHYHEFRQEINRLSQNYQNEIRLVNQQFNKKYSALDVKYKQLLNEYSKFQQQYSKLEKAYEESLKKNEDLARVEVGESQQQSNQQIHNTINLRDDNNSINESTIQTINQLLKKYQKQFNRFISLYESEMEKASLLKQQSFTSISTHNLQMHFKKQIERVESILKENQQTIALMEKQLTQKQEQLVSERQYYQTNEQIYDQRLAHLEMRCNQLNSQLQHLQRKAIDENSQHSTSDVQQSAVLIAVLTSKNNEISSLKEKLIQKQRFIEEHRKEIAHLSAKKVDQLSQLELQEFRAFKNYLQQNDLYSLLSNVQHIISRLPAQEQQ